MRGFTAYIFLFSLVLILSCKNKTDKNSVVGSNSPKPEKEISLVLDTSAISSFLKHYQVDSAYAKNLRSFYDKRNRQFAWMNSAGLNEYARNFLNLMAQEKKSRSMKANFFYTVLPIQYKLVAREDYVFKQEKPAIIEMELLLTLNFFDYSKRNWSGRNNEDLIKVAWFIDRKQLNYENLLDTLLSNNPHSIASFEPFFRQYHLLKNYLIKYRAYEKYAAALNSIDSSLSFQKGDSSRIISALKKQLILLEDLKSKDTSQFFDSACEEAIKKFQHRYGLTEDGIISGKTLIALIKPWQDRIEQILINMERARWVPLEQKDDYLLVNIPAFKLYVYHNDRLEWSCNAIVGQSKVTNNTTIFNDSLEYLVFSPYWNITPAILVKETLPAIKNDPDYLSKHNMEVVDNAGNLIPGESINWNNYSTHFPFIIREKPGKSNSLGLVKFLFPNPYDIYLHDTPSKSLFAESNRTFSHGCIRIEEPYKLACFLLRNDKDWNDEKITNAMNSGKEQYVKLKKKVPVFITYFTAWVDRQGKLNFREDIYHNDAKMKMLLFAN